MATKAGDLLRDYKSKRNFARTQEPEGAQVRSRAGRPSFVVQKHDATRLHFDFRLELDGVLKSWAVTRGPSNDPEDKRLAVRVEDHPVEYGQFEGTIPQGEYGGGTVMLWDQGTWEPVGDPHQGLLEGNLKFRLYGERMKGEYVLVHMKGRDTRRRAGADRENWLLIKHRDNYARDKDTLTARFTRSVATGRDFRGIAAGAKPTKKSAVPAASVWHAGTREQRQSRRVPAFRPVQLATLVDSVPAGEGWLFEMKYDGYRCLAAIAGEDVRLYTRSGLDWTAQFSALVEPLKGLNIGSALIDGEVCAFDARGRTDFSTLKSVLSDGGRLEYFAFDLLEVDGEDITGRPLVERKTELEDLLGRAARTHPVQYSSHVRGHGQAVLDAICRDGHEGVIAKRADAPYRGVRTRNWLKIKCLKRQEFVIGGWSPSSKRRGFASLLLGAWEQGKLVYRGRVGTGFSHEVFASLQARLDALLTNASPFHSVPGERTRNARWVEPLMVAEIAYTEVTSDGILRHPSFIGLREDKPSREVRMENPSALDNTGEEVAEKLGVRLTSPGRVVYPDQGITKSQLVAYYEQVHQAMLPHIKDRPLSLVRCPQGRTKKCFFQKHDTGGFPDQLGSKSLQEKDGDQKDYFYVDDLAGLVAGTQMNVLEWHIWGSRFGDIERPDRLVFDIDPDEGLDFSAVKAAALDIRDRLADQGLTSFPMVTGGKGIHVVVPLMPSAEWPEAKAFCKQFARTLASEQPHRYTANLSKASRKGRLFIDYLRNERGSTAICPWSVRSRQGAPVATPVEWDEVKGLRAANGFGLAEAAERAASTVWDTYFNHNQILDVTGGR